MTIISSATTATLSTSTAGDDILVTTNGSIINSSGYAIQTTGPFAYNVGIQIYGEVVGTNNAIQLDGASTGTFFGGTEVFVAAGGLVASEGAFALQSVGTHTEVTNAGTISATNTALYFQAGDNIVLNTGTISSQSYAIFADQSSISGETEIANAGTIQGSIYIQSGTGVISNSGLIAGTGTTIRLDPFSDNDTLTLVNSGIITSLANTYAIAASGTFLGADTIYNTGLINGSINLVAGTDLVRNHGEVFGDIDLGDGDDTYRGSGSVTGTLDGGSGADTLYTRADLASVSGFETVYLRGAAGIDFTAADDGTGSTIRGNKAGNEIDAGDGDDLLFGRGGDDVLDGGAGKDKLTGGRGTDIFLFNETGDTGASKATADRILDFGGKD
ncbi:MAG TPA: calcium-binding protein, partial [Aliiroseovarius sp.]|nr:calcium-binding protein [Aliiroseovarius sp.]